jgi:prolyl-tRNA editing enzyme YbaK/EbsC (Cys-tRNA(Pro) deacylase)
VATDYVLRLIDQIALMLAEILQLRRLGRAREAHDQIATACLQSVGLPLALVKHSAPETILEMLATGGGTQHVRAIMLAELLLQDAEIEEQAGKKREALISRAQARTLIAHNLGQLSPEEQASYRSKLNSLAQSDVSSKDR